MKVTTMNGRVMAEAETIEDIKTLLSFSKPVAHKPVRGKYECPKCGKYVKYLGNHDRVMHGEGRLLGAVHGDIARRRVPVTRD
jgi:hypothetical protein